MILKAIEKFFLCHGLDRTYWIAYSGGLDSHVLLYLCAQIRTIKLKAIHINHGLNPRADVWAKQCAQVCRKWMIDFVVKTIQVNTSAGESLEDVARQKRYAIFAELLGQDDFLLTAHQQDDQAETVLLQLMRGAGPQGLAAMPRMKSLGNGFHVRPLLDFSRADLKKYVEQHQLHWIEDESNANIHFTRNFLRHEVLPILKKRWPTITRTLARVADHCAEAQHIVRDIALQDLSKVTASFPYTLSIRKLLLLDETRQRQVLRVWLEKLHFSLPSAVKMQKIQQNFLYARPDKTPHTQWGNVELRRYRDELYALSPVELSNMKQFFSWDLQQLLTLPDGSVLCATLMTGEGLRADLKNITVRFRQGGEQCRLPGRRCHHDLKKLFQMWEVPPWQRMRIPLIYVGDRLIAVVGYFIDEEFAAKETQPGYLLTVSTNF